MILVHHQGNMRIGLTGSLNQVLDERLTRILARTRAGLQDDWRTHLVGRGHHRLHLLQVVHIEGRNAIAIGGGMVQQFAH